MFVLNKYFKHKKCLDAFIKVIGISENTSGGHSLLVEWYTRSQVPGRFGWPLPTQPQFITVTDPDEWEEYK